LKIRKYELRKKRNLFSRLFFSFLIFLMVPILGFLLLFQTVITDFIKKEVHQSYMNSLSLLQDYVDLVMNRTWANAISIAMDPRFETLFTLQKESLRTAGGGYNVEYVDAVLDTVVRLRSMIVTDEAIHSFYLYNEETGMIVTSRGETVRAGEYIDSSWLEYYEPGLNSLRILPSRKPVDAALLKDRSVYIDTDRDIDSSVITLMFPLSFQPNRSLSGAVVVNLLEKKIFYPSGKESGHFYFLLDRDGALLSDSSGPEITRAIEESVAGILDSGENEGAFDRTFRNREYMLSYIRSKATGLIFLKMTPLSALFRWVRLLQLAIAALSFLTLLCGSLAAWWFARQIYDPIQSTMNYLRRAVGPGDSGTGPDELKQIRQAVEKILVQDEQITNLLENSRESLTETAVLDLIRGETENASAVFSDSGAPYFCLVLMINRYRQFAERYSYREQFAFRSLILRLSLEVVNRYAAGAGVILGYDKIAIVVGPGQGSQEDTMRSDEARDRMFREILEAAEVNEDVGVVLSAGAVYSGWDHIRRSFVEAMDGLIYRISFFNGRYIDYARLPLHTGGRPDVEPQIEGLMGFLRNGREQEVPRAVEDLVDSLFRDHLLSYDRVLEILSPLVSRTTGFLRSRGIPDARVLDRHRSFYELITDQETRDDLKQALLEYYGRILAVLGSRESSDSPVRTILRYITEHADNPNLDLTLLSDEVGLSYSHTRKLIKDETGLSFVDYLNRLRIDRARELLTATDRPIREIAGEAGYHNDQSLTRFFKKYEGVTPGEFRRQEEMRRHDPPED